MRSTRRINLPTQPPLIEPVQQPWSRLGALWVHVWQCIGSAYLPATSTSSSATPIAPTKVGDMSQHPAPHEADEFRFLTSDAARVTRNTPLPEVRRREVPVTGGRLLSALHFNPAAPPSFVFLHGMGLNAHGFDPVALALEAPTLAIDLPGHGQSSWRDDADYRPEILAPDLALALDALAPAPHTLVGHSLGGLTAALIAPQLPQLKHLVLIDITPTTTPARDTGNIIEFLTGQRDFASQEEMVARAITFGIGEDRAALTRGVALNSRRRPDGRWEWAHHFAHLPANAGAATPAASETGATGTATTTANSSTRIDLWGSLTAAHDAGIPVTLIRASHGFVDETQLAEWQQQLPKSTTHTLPGPHNLHEADPKSLAAILQAL